MVVEDESVIAKDLEGSLRRLGYDVPVMVRSGETALELVESVHPDLVLMDVRLHGELDGVETAREIQFRHELPVVYLTAYADDTTLSRSLATNPAGFLVKPFQERELHAAIETALHKHQLEQDLRHSEEHYRTLGEAIPQLVWRAGDDGRMEYLNQQWLDYTGMNESECLGDGWQRAVHPADLPDLIQRWRETREGGIEFEIECRLRRGLDQSYRWHLMRAQMLRNMKGNPRWFGTFTYIGLEMEGKEALRKNEAQMRALIEAAPYPTLTLDREGEIMEVNPAVEKAFGWPEIKLTGRSIFDTLLTPEWREQFRRLIADLVNATEPQVPTRQAEFTLQRANGTQTAAEIILARIQSFGPTMFAAYLRELKKPQADGGKREGSTNKTGLDQTLSRDKTLLSFMKMCAACKRVVAEDGQWQSVDLFLKEIAGVRVSHGVCPDCAAKLYPKPPAP